MTGTTHRFARAVSAALGALLLATPFANAAAETFVPARGTTLAPPTLQRQFHRFRWHPSTRALQGRAGEFADPSTFGLTAVIGFESNGDLQALRDDYGFDRMTAIPLLHAARVSLDPAHLDGLLSAAPNDPRIRYVSPLGERRQLLHVRNDPLLRKINPALRRPFEWQFAASRVDLAMNLSRGSATILIGQVDTGVADIPDLDGKVDGRYYSDRSSGGGDDVGHGTAVASLMVANVDDGFGMAGFGGAAHLISYRDDELTDESIAAGVAKLTSLGCRIINLSIGGPSATSPVLLDALHAAMEAGVLVVAAAGNEGASSVLYPAADLQPPRGADSLGLAVGASDVTGKTTKFSNRGTNLSLIAPGDYDYSCSGVLAAIPAASNDWDSTCFPIVTGKAGSRYAYIGGTSFSSPEVAGVAALILATRPELSNLQVADIIKRSAHRSAAGWTPVAGYGLLDAAAALELATGRSSADVLTITDFRDSRDSRGATLTGHVAWSDGSAPTAATVACSAAGVAAVAGFSHGRFACRWPIAGARAHGALTGTVTVTAARARVSQAFKLGQPRVP
jgi:subtilisin family serine protease